MGTLKRCFYDGASAPLPRVGYRYAELRAELGAKKTFLCLHRNYRPRFKDMEHLTCSQGHQNPLQSRFCQYCGEKLEVSQSAEQGTSVPPTEMQPVSTALSSGTRLRDRYVIQSPIGQGGFGRTYLAEDTGRFNEPVVLKELLPSIQGTYALKKAEELFQREALTLHRLQHPQIPRFWEIFQAQKRLFLVQDFVAGSTYQQLLTQRQQQGQTFSEAEILQLLRDLLPVVSYLHDQGVVHRDISPDNIIQRDADQLPILIDLGGVKQLAQEIEYQVTSAPSADVGGTRLGKVGYAPDEQMRLGVVAPHSDLYALAVTALVLLTGKLPQELQDPHNLEWRWQQFVTLSPGLAAILNRMLAARPIGRYAKAGDVLAALNEVNPPQVPPTIRHAPPPEHLGSAGPEEPAVSVRGDGIQPYRPNNTIGWIIVSLVFLTLVGLGAIILYSMPEDIETEPGTLTEEIAALDDEMPVLQGSPNDVRLENLVPFESETGAFAWLVPAAWQIRDRSDTDLVSVRWTDPTGLASLSAFVISDINAQDITAWTEITVTALENTFGDETDFVIEDDHTSFEDGSVRIVWSYTETDVEPAVPILGNSFVQIQGQQASVIQFQVPQEEFERLQDSLNQVIDSFVLSP